MKIWLILGDTQGVDMDYVRNRGVVFGSIPGAHMYNVGDWIQWNPVGNSSVFTLICAEWPF